MVEGEETGKMQPQEKKLAAPFVTLRHFSPEDVDDFFVWVSDDRVTSFCSYHSCPSKDALLSYISNIVLQHPYYRAVCREGGRPVGAVFLTIPRGTGERHRAELGYVLAYSYWGKGIMTAAVRKVLETVFEEFQGLERVEALVEVRNTGSQRVLEKVGFQREGVMRKFWNMKGESRDMIMYSFLSTDKLADPSMMMEGL